MDQYPNDPFNAMSADDLSSQRNAARDSLMLTAQLRVGGAAPTQVRVRNLSSGGMMAEYAAPVANGTPIEVEVRGIGWVPGRIAWAAESRIGIAFDQEIDPMLARKPVGTGKHTPTYAKAIPRF
jgi:hypothetical protein